jgi:non-specific serine/threonine protein kinase
MAEAIAAQWGTATFERAIAQLQREHDNMRAALAWARDSGDSLLGLRLAAALWQFWRSYGYVSEGRAWLGQLLALEATPTDPNALAARQHALHAAGWLASDQHDYAQAAQFFVESMALGQVDGEGAGETDVLLNAARQARATGDYQRATALLEQAMAWHRAQGHGISIGGATLTPALHAFGQLLRELGLVTREQGGFGRASALFQESLAFHRAVDDRACVALALLGLADVARDQGDTERVRTYGEEALAILRELGMQWAIGFTLNTLALGSTTQVIWCGR